MIAQLMITLVLSMVVNVSQTSPFYRIIFTDLGQAIVGTVWAQALSQPLLQTATLSVQETSTSIVEPVTDWSCI